MNNITEQGIYYCATGTPQNAPIGWATYIVLKGANDGYKLQFALSRSNTAKVYYRVKVGINDWDDWAQFYSQSILTDSTILAPLASALGGLLKITSGTLSLSKNTPVTLSCRNKMVILGSNMAYFNGILPMIFSYGTTFTYLSEAYKSQFENNMTISYSDSILTLTGKLDNDFSIPYVMLL